MAYVAAPWLSRRARAPNSGSSTARRTASAVAQKEMAMAKINGNFGRNTRTVRWTVALAAAPLTAALAGATPAAAWDPQATSAEIDNSLNYHAATPYAGITTYPSGAYAAAPRRHQSGSSASRRAS